MPAYCIIETDDGWTIVEHPAEATAEEAAHRHGGIVVDPGPYDNYEDACDALMGLQDEPDDDAPADVPGTRPMEGRYETDA